MRLAHEPDVPSRRSTRPDAIRRPSEGRIYLGRDLVRPAVEVVPGESQRVPPARTNAFCFRRSVRNRSASTCHAQPSTSTATFSRRNARSIRHGPKGWPSTHPVMPASRRMRTSRRSAAESARSAAATRRRPAADDPSGPCCGRGPGTRGEADVALQRPVQEGRPVRQRRCRLEDRERQGGESDAACYGSGRSRAGPGAARRSPAADVDGTGSGRSARSGRRTVESEPVGRCHTADRRLLTRPQPCGPNPGLVGEPMSAHEIDARMQPSPRPLSCPTLHGGPGDAEFDGLAEGDHDRPAGTTGRRGTCGQDRCVVAVREAVWRNRATVIGEFGT